MCCPGPAKPGSARLPGAVHCRTGAVAHVAQWGGVEADTLESLGKDIEAERARTTRLRGRTASIAIASTRGFLGYVGDPEIDSLVGALSRAYGAELAAVILSAVAYR